MMRLMTSDVRYFDRGWVLRSAARVAIGAWLGVTVDAGAQDISAERGVAAARAGLTEDLRVLLDHGLDPNVRTTAWRLNCKADPNRVLDRHSRFDAKVVVPCWLVDHGLDPNAQGTVHVRLVRQGKFISGMTP